MRRLTPTSYLILAFLTLRRWSAYELAEQVARGWADYWPRAISGIYEEPRKLVTHGLATSVPERTGARPRSMYEATAAGRRALKEWVAEPSEPPRLECEAILRVAFADHADKDVLVAQIRSVAAFARRQALKYAEQGTGYLENGGPFPTRLHLNLLIGRLLAEHFAGLMRWSVWAQEEVSGWAGVEDASVAPGVESQVREVVGMFNRIAEMADVDGRRTAPIR
ncbi:MAG: PadR family transcriptional regulator [Actinobacteria bacterium]|nr:PadR family transcriptional regulator [Actinomycetota bacterium]